MHVAVLLPVYNGDELVNFEQAFKSVYNQNCDKKYKVFICKDGPLNKELSTYINKIKEKRDVELIESRKNIGLAGILNKAIKETDFDIYFRMDADDISKPDRFRRQLDYLDQNPEVDVVGTFFERFDEENTWKGRELPTNDTELYKTIFKRVPIAHATLAFRKSFFDKVGLYDSDLKGGVEDYELFSRAFLQGANIANIPEVLYSVRDSSKLAGRRLTWDNIYYDYQISKKLIIETKKFQKIFIVALKLSSKVFLKFLPNSIYSYLKNNFIR